MIHTNGVVELPADHPDATVCGTCGRGWDDTVSTSVTPTPAGRCPFEDEHDDLSHRGNPGFCGKCSGWCLYDDDGVLIPQPIKLTPEEAEQIADLLGGYHGALDNILYHRYSLDELNEKLALIDKLIGRLS